METYLRSCSDVIKNHAKDNSRFHVVLGNEACDLDSMVSALVYAYFLFKTKNSSKLPVPVLNIPRAEFPLRTDSTFLLRESNLSHEWLVFRDEVDLQGLHNVGRLELTLVDHNVLPSDDGDLERAVVEVIDHHNLERTLSPSCPVTVETVGSCASLVTERIFQKAPEVLDQQVAQLLYGTIVLDCVNMAPEAGKVTPKDSQYAILLESRFPNLPSRGVLFQSLQSAKFDVSGLSTEQMLLKDMKAVSAGGDLKLAISVIYLTLEAFLQRQNLERELDDFCRKHGYDVVVAMTISFNDNKEPFRQLAVYSSSALYREEVSQALEIAQTPRLNLSPLSIPESDVRAYLQGNTLASRKKVLPILKDFLKGWESRAMHRGNSEDLEELDADDTDKPLYLTSRQQREEAGLEEESGVPPTPMNSLVEGCPLDNGLPRISAEALVEKFSRLAQAEGNQGGP